MSAAPIEGALPIPIWRILTPGMILYIWLRGLRGIPLPAIPGLLKLGSKWSSRLVEKPGGRCFWFLYIILAFFKKAISMNNPHQLVEINYFKQCFKSDLPLIPNRLYIKALPDSRGHLAVGSERSIATKVAWVLNTTVHQVFQPSVWSWLGRSMLLRATKTNPVHSVAGHM